MERWKLSYAEQIDIISKQGAYVNPTESWEVGDIRTDLDAATGRVGREQFFVKFFENADVKFDDVIIFRSRATRRLFRKLDERKATGGDMVSAAILKRLWDCLAVPFAIVARHLFHQGCWSTAWRTHLICPIFKHGAALTPGNYRGVHLTTILSKTAEKMVGAHLVPYLQRKAFGENQ